MEYLFYPPFFEISPQKSFNDAWEVFCCQILNLYNNINDIRQRKPPDLGVDLLWHSKGIAYQCKSVENGQTGSFSTNSTINSVKKALLHQKDIGWKKYYICTNIEVTGEQEKKVREVLDGIEFLTPSFWVPCCKKFHNMIADRFRLLVSIEEPAVLRSINEKFLETYARKLKTSMKEKPLVLLVYSNRRKEIYQVPASPEFTVDDFLEILISLFQLPNQRTYSDNNISVSLSYSLVLDDREVLLEKTLRELGLKDNSIVTFWKTIVWKDLEGATDVRAIEMVISRFGRRFRTVKERAEISIKKFKEEIDQAIEKVIKNQLVERGGDR